MPLSDYQILIRNTTCGVETSMKILCGKWNALIIKKCLLSPMSMQDLIAFFPDIPPTTFYEKVKSLLEIGMLEEHMSEEREILFLATLRAKELLHLSSEISNSLKSHYPEIEDESTQPNFIKALFGTKWKARILWLLYHCPHARFNQINRSIEGISHKVLSETLRALERDGLVERTVYEEKVGRVEYSLTDVGLKAELAVKLMSEWSKSYNITTEKVTVIVS